MTLRDGGRRSTAEQLELPMGEQPNTPFAGKVLRTAAASPTPPRIPAGDQRLIRALGVGALLAALATIGGALTIDPVVEQTRALAVAGSLALAVVLGLTSLLLLRSFHGHPGVWRVRRRRSLRRGLFAGALIGGYLALRIIGLGGPTGLLIAALLVVVAEAAISRSEIDSV
jgi:hypothetical protein